MKQIQNYIADLHVHSRYSRATSKDCAPETLELWARRKGIDIVGTGDFTHPAWREELKEKLIPAEQGFYILKEEYRIKDGITDDNRRPRFVLSGEISSIYKKKEKTRKVHNLILLSSLEDAENLSKKLETVGNIRSDGRPILGLDSRDLLEITIELCRDSIFIPAHIWTPHFSLFGAFSGFDTIEDCFEDLTPYIHALETGLSSDPAMNWRLSALDSYQLISNSDAHSPSKLGREANLLHIDLNYTALEKAIQKGEGLEGTIEFFPEEGKYFLDGHRKCNLSLTPKETKKYHGICPVCGKKITIGVLHRVEELADREEGFLLPNAKRFESLVPLPEVIASSIGCAVNSNKVKVQYEEMIRKLGAEFSILREVPLEDIRHCAGNFLEEGIQRLRLGQVEKKAGYDGEYGIIEVLKKEETQNVYGQVSLFDNLIIEKESAVTKEKEDDEVPVSIENTAGEKKKQKKKETGLNKEQLEAVQTKDQRVVVIAGPGTGKTKTLIEKIAYLVSNREIEPREIMAITFTNKAASEMKIRLEKRLGGKKAIQGIQIGTFHAICYQILLEKQKDLLLIEEYQKNQIIQEVIKKKKLKLSGKKLLQEISRHKNKIPLQNQWEKEEWEEILFQYQQKLESLGYVDFDDLLRKALEYIKESEYVPSYLFVDEFQDLNQIQYELIKEWHKKGKELFVIGDPDQAIYGFRGSDAKYFSKLKEDFGETKKIRLIQNYRSTPEIIDCAMSAIKRKKEPILTPQQKSGEEISLVTTESNLAESIYVAKQINAMTGGMDMLDIHSSMAEQDKLRSFDEIAVLYRTHQQAKIVEMCLRKESIPCKIVGREDFLEDGKVQAAISFFRFLLQKEDSICFQIYLKEIAGYSEEIIENCIEVIEQKREENWTEELLNDWENLLEQKEMIQNWIAQIRWFYPKIRKENPKQLLEEWIERHGLKDYKMLEKLEEMAVFYEDTTAFLQNLRFGEEADLERSTEKQYHSGVVSLMTLHAAKGLEFPVVFLCGVKKGSLPLELGNGEINIEEERRLFYVGITRAKEKLFILTSKEPSIFLEDLEREKFKTHKGKKKKQKSELEAGQISLFDFL